MTPGAIVTARFTSFRSVPSRGVAVLTMEVPLGRAAWTIDILGSPAPGESIHVGFTRLNAPEGTEPMHGTFEKFSMVAAREALSLSIEMPGELFNRALKLLTIPTVSSDIQVAIARLLAPPDQQTRPTKTPGQLAVQRCALRIKDEPFQRFMLGPTYEPGRPDDNELETLDAVRTQLGIQSRRELANDHEKLQEWWAMERRYEDWLQSGGLDVSVARDARGASDAG